MDNPSVENKNEDFNVIKYLSKSGLYYDAFKQSEALWGPIKTWECSRKQIVAISLYANLGADRRSDSILLQAWRKDKTNSGLIERILYYQLNKFGPILANEILIENSAYLESSPSNQTDLLGFKSILQKIYQNYSGAEKILEEALSLSPDNAWLRSLRINILSAQGERELAKNMAAELFEDRISITSLRTYAKTLLEVDDAETAIELYETNLDKFQSVPLLFEYGHLLVTYKRWGKCSAVIEKIEALRIEEDKHDNKILLSWRGRIAIFNQEIDRAKSMLAQLKNPYWDIVISNLNSSGGELVEKILDVPFLRQKHMTCAPTTFAALCRYWGDEHDAKKIADEICYDGTADTKERQWLRDNSYHFQEFELNSELAYSLIDRGVPFALVTNSGFSSHIQAVIGYNKQVGTLYIMDPSHSDMQESLTKETIESEAFGGARCIVFVPENKINLLEGLDFPVSELYILWDRYTLAADLNDFVAAKATLNCLHRIAPEHRITLIVQRAFFAWNNDLQAILEINTTLLERFDNAQPALITSKYYCLRDLGRREEGLQYLNSLLDQRLDLDILGVLFSETYDTNGDADQLDDLVRKLKRYGGESAGSHLLLANYYWSERQHSLATEHYFYAHCLDETNERYIQAYFKASRHLKMETRSLELLTDRFEKYKIRSPIPAISLYLAHEILDQEHIGFTFLFEALKHHEDDADLVRFLSEKLIQNSLYEQFESIHPTTKRVLDHDSYEEIIATKNERQGDLEPALIFHKNAFEAHPYVRKHGDGYFRILYLRGEQEKIQSVLEDMYRVDPHNTGVLDYIATWHEDPVFLKEVLSQFVLLRPDYGDIRRQLVGVLQQLGMFDAALEQAESTAAHIPSETVNNSFVADCHLKLGAYSKAREISRGVLQKTIEGELAFNTLMRASISTAEKIESLQFVFSEIQRQVIFGDSVWNFWYSAKAILGRDVLGSFIEYLEKKNSHLWHSYSLAASYHLQYSELGKAKEVLLKGIDLFPLVARLYYDLANIHELEGELDQAVIYYQKTLEMIPAWSEVSRNLSEVFETLNKIDSAVEVIKKAIKHNSNEGVLYGYLAELELKNGDEIAATESLKQAVSQHQNYRWGWDMLATLKTPASSASALQLLAKSLAAKAPYSAKVWCDLAYLCEDEKEKFSHYQKALDCDQYCMLVYEDKASYYINRAEYKAALSVFDNTPWGDNLPESLAIVRIDLLTGIGRHEEATNNLKSLLLSLHGYAHLWKKLYELIQEHGSKKELLECCNEAITRNPFDAEVLCYSGEHLFLIDRHKSLRLTVLEKAYNLAPNNQYVALTYIDILISEGDFAKALTCIEGSGDIRLTPFSKAREVNVLCQLKESEKAFDLFKSLVVEKTSDYWCLDCAFKALLGFYKFEVLCEPFNNSNYELTREQSYFFSGEILTQDGKDKNIIKILNTENNHDRWAGMFQALSEFWSENGKVPSQKLIEANFSKIIEDSEIVASLSNVHINEERYHLVAKLFESCVSKNDLPAYVFYHCCIGFQMLGRLEDAHSVAVQGLQISPDNTAHNLRLWHTYLTSAFGGTISKQDMDVIDFEELIDTEKYVFCTLLASLAHGGSELESSKETLSPLLRRCQRHSQHVAEHKLVRAAKRRLRAQLTSSISHLGFFQKLKMKLWISNHF